MAKWVFPVPELPNKTRIYDKELYKARHLIENFFAKLPLQLAMINLPKHSWVPFSLPYLASGLISDTPLVTISWNTLSSINFQVLGNCS
jgi:hypothetical protein